jgi:sugar/nucleoside kinase (ribokinase family)
MVDCEPPAALALSATPIHMFVIGDLVLDHAIEVLPKKSSNHQAIENFTYDVQRRTSFAGGAANAARAFAALCHGSVSLCGIAGRSPWGSFPEILEVSRIYDGSEMKIHFAGRENLARQMNTITRIISRANAKRTRTVRFDDIDYRQILQSDSRDIIDVLRHEHNSRHSIDVIILNDLDMGALSADLIKRIGRFARQHKIPLFIDPKRHWEKYRDIQASVVTPNLHEWWHIVGQPGEHADDWRDAISSQAKLKELAGRTIRAMPNVGSQLIKLDRDGTLLLIRDAATGHRKIFHAPSRSPESEGYGFQLGNGDVMVAVLAYEYACAKKRNSAGRVNEVDFLRCFELASNAVAGYASMEWHRMPNRAVVNRLIATSAEHTAACKDSISPGPAFLPARQEPVELARISAGLGTLVSTDTKFREQVAQLRKFFSDPADSRSGILSAQGGSGKSTLIAGLRDALRPLNIWVEEIGGRDSELKVVTGRSDIEQRIKEIRKNPDAERVVLILDEAFSRHPTLFSKDQGKLLIQTGDEYRTRFLFIDADYFKVRDDLQISGSQFDTRTERFSWPALMERPRDIPLIFGARCLHLSGAQSISITECALAAVTDWLFMDVPTQEQSARKLAEVARQAIESAKGDVHEQRQLHVHAHNLPSAVEARASPFLRHDKFDITFVSHTTDVKA